MHMLYDCDMTDQWQKKSFLLEMNCSIYPGPKALPYVLVISPKNLHILDDLNKLWCRLATLTGCRISVR